MEREREKKASERKQVRGRERKGEPLMEMVEGQRRAREEGAKEERRKQGEKEGL